MKNPWRIVLMVLAVLIVVGVLSLISLFSSAYEGEEQTYVYLYEKYSPKEAEAALKDAGVRTFGFPMLSRMLSYRVRSGRYAVEKGENIVQIFRRLRNGKQSPLNLTIPSVRTLDRLAGYLGERLMIDSTEIVTAFRDSYTNYGYTWETLPELFVPNTYQVYWDMSSSDFMQRMVHENRAFWQGKRDSLAQSIGMSHVEVATLASIVDEETANNAEKPMVAGMYVRRLQVGMPLQADPTVKFALGDFSLRRILRKHLTTDSPYNTYRNTGLPPGPIRIPSVVGIDAVLNYVHHDFLFMCAKEDFSGTHNFARTYSEHLQNARRYARALDERGIK